jgi:hypothetical protein
LGPRWVLAHGCATSRDKATQMSRARSRLARHTSYDGFAFASGQYCSEQEPILTGNILETIESLPCRVPAATVAATPSREANALERCPLLPEEGSQGLRRVELALTAVNVSPARKRVLYQPLQSHAPVGHTKRDGGNGATRKKAS